MDGNSAYIVRPAEANDRILRRMGTLRVFGDSHWGGPSPRMTAPDVQGDDRFRAAPRDDEMTGMGAQPPVCWRPEWAGRGRSAFMRKYKEADSPRIGKTPTYVITMKIPAKLFRAPGPDLLGRKKPF
jgi:hypothetical protein